MKRRQISLVTLKFNALCINKRLPLCSHNISSLGKMQYSLTPSVRIRTIGCRNWIQGSFEGNEDRFVIWGGILK